MLRSTTAVALIALAATFAFFWGYMPPYRIAHVPYDMAVYHYSLADYGFQSLKAGRLPQWDPTMYAGMSFPANIQAAFFYPPTWLMYALSWGRDGLSYQALQDLLFAHVWIGFVLAFVWLKNRKLDPLASALGAAVFAYSGYVCMELQHFGLVAGYTWFPLALWGIDQASGQRSWRPLWKVAAASALCFLAGYPPTWIAFATVVMVYALFGERRWKTTPGVLAALVFSLLLCAIQILPAWDATQMREPEVRYGGGIQEPGFYLSYLLPNFFDFGPEVPLDTNPLREYLYLGAPALVGIALLLRRPRWSIAQPIAVIAACLVMAINPWNKVWEALQHSALLGDVVRSYYFLCGVTVGAALLASLGLDAYLRREGRPRGDNWVVAALVSVGVWAVAELVRWPSGFAAGWWTAADLGVTLGVFTLGLWVYRAQKQPRLRLWMGAALLLCVGVDYKVFGTVKRVNAGQGSGPHFYSDRWQGLSDGAYRRMRGDTRHRVILGEGAPFTMEWRHVGLTTPQGFDPFLSSQYRKMIEKQGAWRGGSDREFDIDPSNAEALRLFGAKYYVTVRLRGSDDALRADPRWRALDEDKDYFRVYEWLDASEPFEAPGEAAILAWEPERRVIRVNSQDGGTFALFDQYWPGWSARVDGSETAVERWNEAYQSIQVPPGEHTVEFRYRERYLGFGAGLSLLALAGLGVWVWRYRRRAA